MRCLWMNGANNWKITNVYSFQCFAFYSSFFFDFFIFFVFFLVFFFIKQVDDVWLKTALDGWHICVGDAHFCFASSTLAFVGRCLSSCFPNNALEWTRLMNVEAELRARVIQPFQFSMTATFFSSVSPCLRLFPLNIVHCVLKWWKISINAWLGSSICLHENNKCTVNYNVFYACAIISK